MFWKSFRIRVVVRILLICGAMYLIQRVWAQENWPMTRIFLLLVVGGLIMELIHYVEKTNRDLQSFLLAIKHKDFTHTFTRELRGKSFAGLKDAFNQIMVGYQELRAEKESHYLYLQNVIEHVSVALICYGDDGEIFLMNQACQRLLDRPYMSNVRILDRVDPKLLEAIQALNTGEPKLVKTVINDELLNISLRATEFKLQEVRYKLVSLQDIRSELDTREIETWQKLIRVLTHEIMNSVTPIISLTRVVHSLLADETGQRRNLAELEEEDADDILQSIQTIESRSKGLLHFVHAYRSLTRIQKPNFQAVNPGEIVGRVCALLKPELRKRQITFVRPEVPPDFSIKADAELIEQVLINLVKNAMEALVGQEDPQIELRVARTAEGRTLIQVRDNGPGIDEEYIDKIFIPFFTTKKKGSGIGLSLSQQIMRMHRGNINLQSVAGEGTIFTLVF
ncbi:MAG: ATP-binding protein [Bacteroidetes bacterium]|nr:MAG: ATP-binding protein [Bacteroidota bacterium]